MFSILNYCQIVSQSDHHFSSTRSNWGLLIFSFLSKTWLFITVLCLKLSAPVIEHHDQKQPEEERVYFILYFTGLSHFSVAAIKHHDWGNVETEEFNWDLQLQRGRTPSSSWQEAAGWDGLGTEAESTLFDAETGNRKHTNSGTCPLKSQCPLPVVASSSKDTPPSLPQAAINWWPDILLGACGVHSHSNHHTTILRDSRQELRALIGTKADHEEVLLLMTCCYGFPSLLFHAAQNHVPRVLHTVDRSLPHQAW